MKKRWKLAGVALVTGCSIAMAEVSVSFPVTDPVLRNLLTVTLDFSVDGSGNVTLDASTSNGGADPKAVVDAWDGPAGTVSDASLFNTSFSLTGMAKLNGTPVIQFSTNANLGDGNGVGVGNDRPNVINRAGEEEIVWTYAGAGTLTFTSIDYANRVAHGDSNLTFLDSDNRGEYFIPNTSTSGSIDLAEDGFSLANGESFIVTTDDFKPDGTTPRDIAAGASLYGLSFDITEIILDPETVELVPDAGVSAGSYTVESFDGRTVWVPNNTATQLFFEVPGTFGFIAGQPVYVRIEYYDSGQGRLLAEYDSTEGYSYKDAEVHARSSRVGGGEFVYSYQMFEYPSFGGGQTGGNDFRFKLLGTDGTPLRIASVQISNTIYTNETLEYAVSRPWLEPNTGPVKDFIDNQTLVGKVMAGYQGWFAVPNDLDDLGWRHWSRNANIAPDPTQITIDAWPYLNDYNLGSLYPAGDMLLQDGRPAYLFSTRDPDVVHRHFRWMRKHNIDGIYLQRFVTTNSGGGNGQPEFVLDNVRKAASAEGRIWAIEYDVSSLDGNAGANIPLQLEVMTNDWNYLVNECHILDDPRYAHEDGKPVLFIWGFGTGNNVSTAAQADPVISWFASQNLHLIGGVSKGKINDANWQPVLRKYDTLLEWMEGNLSTLTSRRQQLEGFGMKLLPHAWPGFSWNNLQQTTFPTSYTPRNGGQFYWDRLKNAVNCGADQIFLGMFDEYDEGTVIMPFSDSHPDIHTEWGNYIDNGGRDPFWWLSLSGAGREMLNGLRSSSSGLPSESSVTPPAYGGDDATAFLGSTNIVDNLVQKSPPDGQTEGLFLAGYDCRTNNNIYFYFDIEDARCNSVAEGQAVTVEVEFLDSFPGTRLRMQYDGVGHPYTQHSTVVNPPDSGGWKTVRWTVFDGYFGNRQNGGSDFRIATFTGETTAIRRVSVFFPEEQNGMVVDGPRIDFSNGWTEWPATADATGWRLAETDNLVSNDWNEIAGPFVFSNDVVQYGASTTNRAGFFRLQRPERQ